MDDYEVDDFIDKIISTSKFKIGDDVYYNALGIVAKVKSVVYDNVTDAIYYNINYYGRSITNVHESCLALA